MGNELLEKVEKIVAHQFDLVTNLTQEAYIDSLRMIAEQTISLISAEARKQVARELFDIVHSRSKQEAYDKAVKYWQALDDDFHYDAQLEAQDQILNIKCSRGGVCPACKGEKMVDSPHKIIRGNYKKLCPSCDGLGQKPIETKTLGELAEDYENKKRS